jgi:hypothetical protein
MSPEATDNRNFGNLFAAKTILELQEKKKPLLLNPILTKPILATKHFSYL